MRVKQKGNFYQGQNQTLSLYMLSYSSNPKRVKSLWEDALLYLIVLKLIQFEPKTGLAPVHLSLKKI